MNLNKTKISILQVRKKEPESTLPSTSFAKMTQETDHKERKSKISK